MALSLRQFWSIGREQRYDPWARRSVRWFTWVFGPLGLHSRIRAGHVLNAIKGADLPQNPRILDAGCGHGLVLFWLASHRAVSQLRGVEKSSQLAAANEAISHQLDLPTSATFEQGDLVTMNLGRDEFDLVVSIDVLEHIDDDVHVLKKLRRALKPDGLLVLHLPLRHQQQCRLLPGFEGHTIDSHVRDEYLPDEIESKLEVSGFQMTKLGYGFGWSGELAFELNNLFWRDPTLRAICALLTYPLAWMLAFHDVNAELQQGNSMVIEAKPQTRKAE